MLNSLQDFVKDLAFEWKKTSVLSTKQRVAVPFSKAISGFCC